MSERDTVAHGLIEDLQVARASAKLAFHLRAMVRHKSKLVYLADDLVWLTLRAMRDTAVIHLWKVLDTQSSAQSLPWFIRRHSSLAASDTSSDLSRLTTANSDVQRLMRLRHNIFAHRGRDSTEVGAQALLEAHNLSEQEFLGLIEICREMLRRHFGSHLPSQIAHSADGAIDQIIELEVFLADAFRGRWGIERYSDNLDID